MSRSLAARVLALAWFAASRPLRPRVLMPSLVARRWRVSLRQSRWPGAARSEHALQLFENGTFVLGESAEATGFAGRWHLDANPHELLDRLHDVICLRAQHDGVRVELRARLYARYLRRPFMTNGLVHQWAAPAPGRTRRPRWRPLAGRFHGWVLDDDEPVNEE